MYNCFTALFDTFAPTINCINIAMSNVRRTMLGNVGMLYKMYVAIECHRFIVQ